MSDMITIDIEAPQGVLLEGAQIPDDYTVQEAIDELVDSLVLPRKSENGESIEYALFSVTKKLNLAPQQLIRDTSLRSGDTVKLVASHQLQGTYTPPPPTIPSPPEDNEIQIVLSVLDLNRHETVSLPKRDKVGELIRQIVQNYDLPSRDKLGQLIKYRLQSKAMGRFLEETITLDEANIPTLDRLTLHRDHTAGA